MSSTQDEQIETEPLVQSLQLTAAYAVPMTLKAVIELGMLEMIDGAEPGRELSSTEIASKISTSNPKGGPAVLDRMMQYLDSHSVRTCSVVEGEGSGRAERRFGLAPVCKFFVSRRYGTSLDDEPRLGLSR